MFVVPLKQPITVNKLRLNLEETLGEQQNIISPSIRRMNRSILINKVTQPKQSDYEEVGNMQEVELLQDAFRDY